MRREVRPTAWPPTLNLTVREEMDLALAETNNFMGIDQDNEFIRIPITDTRVLCLQSLCIYCGFTIFASSIYELVEEEDRHLRKCSLMHDAVISQP